jgi:hypothetical protein
MPYSIENKARARTFYKAIQIKTVCRGCGKQPVEWHNPEHKNHLGRRVHALVSLGYPVERIAAEMGTCTPLCRHCHMLLDGRLSKLIAARPYKKGDCPPAKPCAECGQLAKPLRKGWCSKCAQKHWQNPFQRGISTSSTKTKTYCRNGHSLSGKNLYVHPKTGYGSCHACHRNHEQQRIRRLRCLN